MSRWASGLFGFLAATIVGSPSPAAPQAVSPIAIVSSVAVAGSTFQVALADGRVLAQHELPGMQLSLGDGTGQQRRIRIDAIERDPKDATGETILYAMSEQEGPGGAWHDLCLADPDGKHFGFPLSGRFSPDGSYVPAPGRILITCTGGAEGKCIRFGYRPWRQAADGTSLGPAYNACVRLVRADYAGDGRGTTRNGQRIDIYDAFGIQVADETAALPFEAGFTAAGAVCVNHVRVKENVTLAEIETAPRLRGHTGQRCTEDYARNQGAILFVRSPL